MSQYVDRNHASEEALTTYALHPETVEEPIAQHIKQCQVCLRKASEITLLQRALLKKLARFDCPDAESLTAYALHEISPGERAKINKHLVSCQDCAEEVRMTQETSAKTLLSWEVVRRVAASLLPRQAPDFQYSMRALEDEDAPSHILQTFVAQDVEVTLGHYAQERGQFLFTGRIDLKPTVRPLTPLAARLLGTTEDQQPVLIAEIPLGPDGFFELGPVPAGVYQLEILLSDCLIEIRSLHL